MTEVSMLVVVVALVALNSVATIVLLLRGKRPSPPHPAVSPADPALHLDTSAIQQAATTAFTAAIDTSATQFKQDIQGSSARLSDLIVRLTTEVVERELETYRTELAAARDEALKGLETMRETLATKQTELESGIDSEVAERKQELLTRLDAKLGTAVMTYIVERLGQGVDLGAQRDYLLESLKRNKDEMKKDLEDAL